MASSGMKRYGSVGFDPYMYVQKSNSSIARGIADGADNFETGKELSLKLKAKKKKRMQEKKIKQQQKNQGNLNRMSPGAMK